MTVVRNGVDYDRALEMDEIELQSYFYTIMMQEGWVIDWATGLWSQPEAKTPPSKKKR